MATKAKSKSSSKRDDFNARTKEILAKRAGYQCSNPECKIGTIGASSEPGKYASIGQAAHITAASKGGPRYDSNLTLEARKSPDNGIWMCSNHAKLVDSDPIGYTVQKLKEWKNKIEDETKNNLASNSRVGFELSGNSSFEWVFLGNRFLHAISVKEINGSSITLEIRPETGEDDICLRSLTSSGEDTKLLTRFAFQNLGAIVQVEDAKRNTSNNITQWCVTLSIISLNAQHQVSEPSFNELTPDQIAVLRARLILFNENPIYIGHAHLPEDDFGRQIFSGIVTKSIHMFERLEEDILPKLWQIANKDEITFRSLARLALVYNLIVSGTCKDIVELDVGPVDNNKVHIRFTGRRMKRYEGHNPFVISLEGDCNLE